MPLGHTQIGALLRGVRKRGGVRQSELAHRLGRPQSFVSKYERDERRLDVMELLEILEVLECEPSAFLRRLVGGDDTVLDRWELTAEELTAVVDENPSLRGMLLGYVAEQKLAKLLENHDRGYTDYQRRHLLATMVSVTWPPEPPFYDEPWGLLREIGEER